MKRLFVMMLALVVFTGCSKEESKILSEGDKITRSIKQVDTPLMNVLKSGKFWEESRAFAYTEPDGKGEELALFDAEISASAEGSWQPYEVLVFSNEQLMKYIPMTKLVRTYHYYDFDITKFENNTFTFTRNSEEYYLKVLAYNEKSIWVETNCYDVDKNYQKKYGRADSYPYVRILYSTLPPNTSYPLEGWASEEEITPYEIEYPVELPENFFEIAEGTPIWRQDVGYSLVYDKDKLLCDNESLVVNKGLGKTKYDNTLNTRYLYKFVDGVLYRLHYIEDARPKEGVTYYYLKIEKYENPQNYLLGVTDNNQIILSEQDYNILIEKPYYKNIDNEYNQISCYFLTSGDEKDITLLKWAYESPIVQKIYCNFG